MPDESKEFGDEEDRDIGDGLPLSSLRLFVPPLRLVSAALWQVVQQGDVMNYGLVEEFVSIVLEVVPDMMSYREKVQLILGLRSKLVLELCRSDHSADPETIQPHLSRMRACVVSHTEEINLEVDSSEAKFLELVQNLLDDPNQKKHFFKDVFPEQFGPMYDMALQTLMWEFLSRLDKLLPTPTFHQAASWLRLAPSMLKETAQCVTQPQPLKTLLKDHRSSGHLFNNVSLSCVHDRILSSLSYSHSKNVNVDIAETCFKSTCAPRHVPASNNDCETMNEENNAENIPGMSSYTVNNKPVDIADLKMEDVDEMNYEGVKQYNLTDVVKEETADDMSQELLTTLSVVQTCSLEQEKMLQDNTLMKIHPSSLPHSVSCKENMDFDEPGSESSCGPRYYTIYNHESQTLKDKSNVEKEWMMSLEPVNQPLETINRKEEWGVKNCNDRLQPHMTIHVEKIGTVDAEDMSQASPLSPTAVRFWSAEETDMFIAIWSNKQILQKLEQNYRRREVYDMIAKLLNNRGFKRTWKQCQTKMKDMKYAYRLALRKPGRVLSSPLFSKLHTFLSPLPNMPESTENRKVADKDMSLYQEEGLSADFLLEEPQHEEMALRKVSQKMSTTEKTVKMLKEHESFKTEPSCAQGNVPIENNEIDSFNVENIEKEVWMSLDTDNDEILQHQLDNMLEVMDVNAEVLSQTSLTTMHNVDRKWSLKETNMFIAIWSNKQILQKLEQSYRKREVYDMIAKLLNNRGFKRTWKQCQTKMKDMKYAYRLALRKPGRVLSSPLFSKLHTFLSTLPNMPECTENCKVVDKEMSLYQEEGLSADFYLEESQHEAFPKVSQKMPTTEQTVNKLKEHESFKNEPSCAQGNVPIENNESFNVEKIEKEVWMTLDTDNDEVLQHQLANMLEVMVENAEVLSQPSSTTMDIVDRNWSLMETNMLIAIWSNKQILQKLGQSYRKRKVYEMIAKLITNCGFKRTWKQCQTKMKDLKYAYRLALRKPGRALSSPFFFKLHPFLSTLPEMPESKETGRFSVGEEMSLDQDEGPSVDVYLEEPCSFSRSIGESLKRSESAKKCSVCESFVEGNDYISHMTTHNEQSPHKCNKYGEGFEHLDDLQIPNQNESEEISQQEISEPHPRKDRIARLASTNTNNCRLCRKTFTFQYLLRRHLMIQHKGKSLFKCPMCLKGFAFFTALKKHQNKKRCCPISEDVRKRMSHIIKSRIKCSCCLKAFVTHSQLKSHQQNRRGCLREGGKKNVMQTLPLAPGGNMNEIPQPSIKVTEEPTTSFALNISVHPSSKKMNLKACAICNKTFRFEATLVRHIASHQNQSLSKCPEILKCNFCKETFTRGMELKIHYSRVHQFTGPFPCPSCQKTFVSLIELRLHQRNEPTPYQCSVCQRFFTSKNYLTIHERIHTGEKPFLCSECGKVFTSKMQLQSHSRCHIVGKLHTCSTCGKRFKREELLKQHMLHHKDARFVCPDCGKKFFQLTWLRRHMFMHTGERPFLCDLCGKGFKSTAELKIHTMTHTGERPYRCPECGKGCRQKSELQEHRRRHTGERPYPCSMCDKRFYSSNIRKRHMLIHTGEKPFKCQACGMAFNRGELLSVHRSKLCR
ncbi:hypothetical protein UPYG_G00339470 [Umbra pygmaea]|uniref:C2H2-type domain-containing protein n=1 Tax=Umbra pygmaea TaxID=75934 RepID=A0ABD0W0T9_UMBPY